MTNDLNSLDKMEIFDSYAVPPQQEGDQADIVETRKASNSRQAKLFFDQAKDRLYDINKWDSISEGMSASFVLIDKYGNVKNGLPAVGDHIRINIPGPGSSAGEGYDWVRIEIVQEKNELEREFCIIKVRPSEDPSKKEGTAHFFESQATSSFIVKRDGILLAAEIHGRNEKPNTDNKKLTDRIRNLVVSTAATSGLAKIKWEKLAKGLLNFQKTRF
jgi:hypothetical protein